MGSSELTFEDALKKLEELVGQLESGQLPLDQALQIYAQGVELARSCRNKLEQAEEYVLKLSKDNKGEFVLEELDLVWDGGKNS